MQTISVLLSDAAGPARHLEVRLYKQQHCQGEHESATTSDIGRVRFSRPVEIGGHGVITDELSICVRFADSWTPIFSSLHGPAPMLIETKCALTHREPSCFTSFDGRLIEHFPIQVGHDA